MSGERHQVDIEAALQDIYGALGDIEVALSGIGCELEALVKLIRWHIQVQYGEDPLAGTSYAVDRDEEPNVPTHGVNR